MPLGTLDRTPPPFFKQGMSALSQLVFFSALAFFLMVADTRLKVVQPLRAVIATALHPVELALLAPVDAWRAAGDYLDGVGELRERERTAQRQLAEQAERAGRVERLTAENERLRGLLELRAPFTVRSQAAEVLYEAPDPYTRKIVIDRGLKDGLVAGSPVVDRSGVLGQVTRVHPLASEVTLLTDKDASIPVLNTRTQSRAVAYGDPAGVAAGAGMELRFLASNADVLPGDLMNTSGMDGVYPPGLGVARVVAVDRQLESTFAKVTLAPLASPDAARHVLVLEPLHLQLPPRPAEPAASAPASRRAARPGSGRPPKEKEARP
jgi:rod shape-determining protein MreC